MSEETINIANKSIEVKHFDDWALALMSRGVIVRLAISRWRGKTQLDPETLGLRFAGDDGYDFMNKYMNLGSHNLLPPENIESLTASEREARDCLINHSFNTIWGRFVPYTAFNEWEQRNQEIRKSYMTQGLKLGNEYSDVIKKVKEGYRKLARDVWYRLYPESQGEPTFSFIEEFVDKIVKKIPPMEEIVSSFKYDTAYFVIPMPSFVQENIAKAENIRVQSEMEQFNSDLEKQTKIKISEEYMKRKKELIDGFLESTVLTMRKSISDLCTSVLKNITKTQIVKSLTNDHFNRIKATIRKVKLLNFYNDDEISKLLLDLETEMDKIKGEADNHTIANKLREIIEVTEKEFTPRNYNPAISSLEL
jgi:hypothetical protein